MKCQLLPFNDFLFYFCQCVYSSKNFPLYEKIKNKNLIKIGSFVVSNNLSISCHLKYDSFCTMFDIKQTKIMHNDRGVQCSACVSIYHIFFVFYIKMNGKEKSQVRTAVNSEGYFMPFYFLQYGYQISYIK